VLIKHSTLAVPVVSGQVKLANAITSSFFPVRELSPRVNDAALAVEVAIQVVSASVEVGGVPVLIVNLETLSLIMVHAAARTNVEQIFAMGLLLCVNDALVHRL
jgi:hypothetical protein